MISIRERLKLSRERLKLRRKMLELSKEKVAEDLDMTLKEVEECENLKPQKLISHDRIETKKPTKYTIEIYRDEDDNPNRHISIRDLELFEFEGIKLLLGELRDWADYTVEFAARIRPSDRVLEDEVGNLHYKDTDVLEIIEIKKVKNNGE